MQDGQNLFDPEMSFAGVAWHADETAQGLILKKKMQPLIIVAISNTGDRLDEYTPVRSRGRGTHVGGGGRADEYGRMLTEELKPFIDGEYRTLPQREFTGVGGSSLGGLFALHMGFTGPISLGVLPRYRLPFGGRAGRSCARQPRCPTGCRCGSGWTWAAAKAAIS